MKTYFIKNNVNSLVKIGKSINVERRVSQIKGQCSFLELTIFHVIDGNFEASFHDFYRHFRKEGEWFDIPNLSVEMIEDDFKGIQSPAVKIVEKAINNRTYPEEVPQKEIESHPDTISFLIRGNYSATFLAFLMTLQRYTNGYCVGILKRINEVKEDIEHISVDNGETYLYITKENSMQIKKKSEIGDSLLIVTVKYTNTELTFDIGEEEY